MNQQSSVITDATFVLEQLDDTNKKALYRRAHAYRTQEKYEQAARDLQNLMKAHGEDDDMKEELKQCMSRMMIQKKKEAEEAKKAAEAAKNKPKIQEIDTPEPVFKKIQI